MIKPREILFCLACLLVAGASAPALAQSRAPDVAEANKVQARALFGSGETAYRMGDFKQALKHFRAALELYSRASIVLNIAQCYRQLEQTNQALFYYKLYMVRWERENPGKPNPYAVEVTEHIASLKARTERSTRATLAVSSRPTGARITFDGRELAMTTPVVLKDLSPGKHSVVLRQGTLHFSGTVELRAAQRTELVAVLEELLADVKVTSNPPGAEVLVEGRPMGRTPLALRLPMGQATLELSQEGYVTTRRLVKVEGPNPLSVRVILGLMSVIKVTSKPPGASVYLDGRGVGVAPAELRVKSGRHKVRLERPGREPQTREVEVSPGQTVTVAGTLPLTSGIQEQISTRRTHHGFGWAGIGLGIAGALTGGVLIVYGKVTEDEAAEDYRFASVQSRMDEAYDEQVAGRKFLTAGSAVALVGVVLVVAGSVAVGLAPDYPTEAKLVSVGPVPGGAGFSVGGRF